MSQFDPAALFLGRMLIVMAGLLFAGIVVSVLAAVIRWALRSVKSRNRA